MKNTSSFWARNWKYWFSWQEDFFRRVHCCNQLVGQPETYISLDADLVWFLATYKWINTTNFEPDKGVPYGDTIGYKKFCPF